MANLGDVFLRLLLDDSDFEQQIVQKAQKAGDKAGQSLGARVAAGISRGATDLGRTLGSIGQDLTKTGRSMTTNLTLPIVAAGAATSKLALDFDTTFRQIVGLTDVTADEMAGLRDEVLALAPAVGKGPQELGEALYFIVSAGFEANEAMDVLETSAKAAAAGLGETQTVAQVLGSVINAYGRENITAARAADILTEAVSQGTAEADAFAGVVGRVVPAAASLGVEFDQVTAALAGMTLTGLSAEEAAVGLNQVFISLLKPTADANAALEEMGLSAQGLRDQLREEGLLATLRTLEDRFGGNEQAAARVFGNVRALRTVTSLLTLDTQQLNDVFSATENSLGRLETAYQETEGPQREIDRAMADMQVTAIQLGSDVLPLLVEVMKELGAGARALGEWWRSLDDDTKRLVVRVLAFAAAVGPVVLIVGKLATGLGAVFKAIGWLTGAKGLPLLVKNLGRAGLVGALIAVAVVGQEASKAFGDFVTELIHGKKAAEAVRGLRDQLTELGDAAPLVAAKLDELGVTSEDLARVVEAAGGDVETAARALVDSGGSVAGALVDLQGAVGDLDFKDADRQAREFGINLEQSVGEGATRAELVAAGLPPELAGILAGGADEIGAGADAAMSGVDDAAADARAAAIDHMKQMLAGISGMFESDESLREAFQGLLDRMDDPYTEAERRADIFSQTMIDVIRGGIRSGDPKLAADTATMVENALGEIEAMEPGALATGEAVPKKLREGMDRQVSALITWIEENITHESLSAMTFTEADELGFANLWLYAQGMERARRQRVSREITTLQSDLRTRMSIDLSQSGYNAVSTFADGMSAAEWRVFDAAWGIGNTLRGGLAIYSEPKAAWSPLRGITHWGGNMVKTIAAGILGESGALARAIALAGSGLSMSPALGGLGAYPLGALAPATGALAAASGGPAPAGRAGDTIVYLEGILPVRSTADVAYALRSPIDGGQLRPTSARDRTRGR